MKYTAVKVIYHTHDNKDGWPMDIKMTGYKGEDGRLYEYMHDAMYNYYYAYRPTMEEVDE